MELTEQPDSALEVSGDRGETAVLANVLTMVPEVSEAGLRFSVGRK